MKRTAVIDFETTGLSPTMGDRATEVAIGQIRHDLRRHYGVGECRHDLLVKVQRSARHAVPKVIAKYLQGGS